MMSRRQRFFTSRFFSQTQYDKNHEAIQTTLYYWNDINDTRVLIGVAGWKKHDDMMALWKKNNRL